MQLKIKMDGIYYFSTQGVKELFLLFLVAPEESGCFFSAGPAPSFPVFKKASMFEGTLGYLQYRFNRLL